MLVFVPICYATACEIIWTHFQINPISRYYSYPIHAQFTSQVAQYLGAIFQTHAENSIGQGFSHLSGNVYAVVFGHGSITGEIFHALIISAAFRREIVDLGILYDSKIQLWQG